MAVTASLAFITDGEHGMQRLETTQIIHMEAESQCICNNIEHKYFNWHDLKSTFKFQVSKYVPIKIFMLYIIAYTLVFYLYMDILDSLHVQHQHAVAELDKLLETLSVSQKYVRFAQNKCICHMCAYVVILLYRTIC